MLTGQSSEALVWDTQDVPRAHPDCLTGKTFVITGNLESLGRDEATELVKKHSGRVTGSVSGKTTFLLVGQDSGRKKVDMVRPTRDLQLQAQSHDVGFSAAVKSYSTDTHRALSS